jgi:MoCo/4Fe-4S cofactor protein with predicted Tat translocation signal
MSNDKLRGKEYWRSLDQLAETPEYTEFLHREFPAGASEMTDPMTRRKFLTLMGASAAFAGLVSCRRPLEKIIPYVASPQEIVPGVSNFYATTMPFGNDAFGLVVESHEGRPTKIEGNINHPATMGRSNTFIQGSILNLYDPDRSKAVLKAGVESTWDDFVTFWRQQLIAFKANKGAGLAILSEAFSSPTLARLQAKLRQELPEARWVTFEPISDENIYRGIEIATGKMLQPIYHFEKAEIILSFDSDFVYLESDNIRNAKGFSDGRRISSEHDSMNRLYQVEGNFSLTGTMADHRYRLESSRIGAVAAAIGNELKNLGLNFNDSGILDNYKSIEFDSNWIHFAASDLMKARGKSLVIAGRSQDPEIHALVMAINSALGNIGNTITFRETPDSSLSKTADLVALTGEMNAGKISTLVILGGNPVYNAPADLNFVSALKNVQNSIYLGSYNNETAQYASWHIPRAHYLELWGDARSIDGTVSVIQPLIEPLFGGKSAFELLNVIATGENTRGYDIVRETWRGLIKSLDFEASWRQILNDGFSKENSFAGIIPEIKYDSIWSFIKEYPFYRFPETETGHPLELSFQPSPTVYDGRFANNGWLQEIPHQLTKITWDNTATISPDTARNYSLNNGDMINIDCQGRTLQMPVWILPGLANFQIVINLGYGRKSVGRIGDGVGFDTYSLRQSSSPFIARNAFVNKTGQTYKLATTQDHGSMEGRPIVREATLDHYREHPEFAREMVEIGNQQALWTEHQYTEGYQWGMAIDLQTCIGCNACNIACYSENNIPIVGKEQVARGREMAWIRVDRYFNGDLNDPEIVTQPVPCMHCENAPCEQVCPVNAVVHDKEGLNVQVYNRCIGTRYCSNNCPYKVRRFNFFNYTSKMPEVKKMVMNPDVTVRSRGIMEKCTYCVQRINKGRMTAKLENRDIRDGEVVPACAQACPTKAIVFGNINDPDSQVSKVKAQNRNYGMLAEYNTRPRTTYLAKIRNPHPGLEKTKSNS